MSGLEGNYRSAESMKRRAEVLERMRAGIDEKKIIKDLGIARHSFVEIVERLRQEGSLPAPRSGEGPFPAGGEPR